MKKKMTRREFVKRAGGVVAGVTIPAVARKGRAAEAKPGILNYNPAMNYRRLGKSGLMFSEVSFGGHWRTRENKRYWGRFPDDKIPTDVLRDREDVFGRAIELGVNYLDITTPAEASIYGAAMKSLGQRMHVGYSDYILCIRNPKNRNVKAMMFEIDEGLRRLQMDCIDLWRPQALTNGKHTDEEMALVVEAFLLARKQGKVRYLGISSHDRPFLIHLMQTFPEFTQVIFPYMGNSKEHPDGSIFDVARKCDVGTTTIKPFAGGSLFRREQQQQGDEYDPNKVAELYIRKIISNKKLTAMLPGMTTVAELENNVRVAMKPRALSRAELDTIERIGRETLARLPHDYAWLRDWEFV